MESPPARLRGRRGHPEEAAGPPVWFRCGNSRCHVGSERARQTAQDRAAGSPGTAGRLSVSPRGGARGPVRAGNPKSLFAVCRGGARCTEGARRGAEAPGGHAPLRPAPRGCVACAPHGGSPRFACVKAGDPEVAEQCKLWLSLWNTDPDIFPPSSPPS